MLGVAAEDFEVGVVVAPRRSVVAVRALVGMSGDGVLEADDQIVEGAGPATGVVAGECETCDDLPIVEVALQVEGEFVDLVEGSQETLCPGGSTEADHQVHGFRGAVLKSPLLLLVW